MNAQVRLGRVLEDLRELAGVSRAEMALQLGYKSRSSVTKIEQGRLKNLAFVKVWELHQTWGFSFEDLGQGMQAYEAGRGEEWKEEVQRRRAGVAAGSGLLGSEGATEELAPYWALIQDMIRGLLAFLRFFLRSRG